MTTTPLVQTMRADNLRHWLELEAVSRGTESQRERFAAGVLPEDEITQLARAELYKGFEGFPRWSSREGRLDMRGAMRTKHHPVNGEPCPNQPLMQAGTWTRDPYEVSDVGELTDAEWTVLKRIHSQVQALLVHPWIRDGGGGVKVDSVTHWLTCSICKAEVARSVAKVSVHWAERMLVREYRLTVTP